MKAVILNEKPLTNGSTEVTLSKDGVRFTITVPTSMLGTETVEEMYEFAGSRVVERHARLVEITRPGRIEAE